MSTFGQRFPRPTTPVTSTVSTGARGDVAVTTGSLTDGNTEVGTLALGKTITLLRVSANAACRVRLYATAAYRTADAARAIGTDLTGEHGCIFDANILAGNLTLDLMPQPRGSNLDGAVTDLLYYNIENKSGSTRTITVTFTRQNREA